jgi:hypothetical protein
MERSFYKTKVSHGDYIFSAMEMTSKTSQLWRGVLKSKIIVVTIVSSKQWRGRGVTRLY